MIFLSHNWKDKDIVEPVAVKLKEIYGENNVFYDSWSIKPGENIIGKMNEGISSCRFFFYFISENSLNSSMVNLEWQSALYKMAKEGIKFIPVKLDNSLPPQILISTLYIDMFNYGFEYSLRNIFDIIESNDTKQYKSEFQNILVKQNCISEKECLIKIESKLIEPNCGFAFLFNNKKENIELKVKSDNIVHHSSGDINGIETLVVAVDRVLSPGFPFEISIKTKNDEKLDLIYVLHQSKKNEYKYMQIINW